jgi:hypothetical protein
METPESAATLDSKSLVPQVNLPEVSLYLPLPE